MNILLIVRNTDIDIWVLLQSEDYVDIVSTGYEDLDKLSRFFQQNVQRAEQFMPSVRTDFI